MIYLGIDTSGSHLTVAIGGDKSAVRFIPDCALSHSVVLMDELELALNDAGCELKDIDIFACALGPGSFTGIRIGVATAKALSYAMDKKVLGVTSFDTLAYNVISEKRKLALIGARHGNYYAAGFSAGNTQINAPAFLGAEEVKAFTADYQIISDEETEFNSVKADLKNGFIKAVEAKLHLATFDRESLLPIYVKKSQAEEEL